MSNVAQSLKLHMRLCRTMPSSSSSTPQVKSRRVIKTIIKNDVDDNNEVEIDHICGKCSKSYKSIGVIFCLIFFIIYL